MLIKLIIIFFCLKACESEVKNAEYFQFTPFMKVRQCARVIDYLKECFPESSKEYDDLFGYMPPWRQITPEYTKYEKLDTYFQFVVYLDTYASDPNIAIQTTQRFCGFGIGFCLECLIKDHNPCFPVNSTRSDRQCARNHGIRVYENIFSLCLSGAMNQSTGKCTESVPAIGKNCPSTYFMESKGNPCKYSSFHGRTTRLYADGRIIDAGFKHNSQITILLIGIIIVLVCSSN